MAVLTSARLLRMADLFERALELPGDEREAYVAAACAGDRDLESELRRILKSDADVRTGSDASRPPLPRFGVYQARELIGAGGMGAVYRATREDGDVRQQVAIKVVGSVLWSAAIEQRFRRERQILAQLQHPSIARFLDSGVTEDGRPFLVMEFVQGERIDVWCDRHHFTIAQRLNLFLKVCDAVNAAHQNLVIHRDIKPSNILVANAEPRLLDFGVAQTLDPSDVEGLPAQTSGLFFTPLYASPELLRGEVTGVGCDVYSLGVLLFELLTGTHPLGKSARSAVEVIEHVLAAEPRLASASVVEGGDSAVTRGLGSATQLRRALRGDLDSLLAKAMAKSPAARYPSVEQLADDVKRYLGGFPVRAAATGTMYRLRKFVRRHGPGVTAGTMVTVALIGGLAATLWQSRIAQKRFDQTRALARYLMFDLTQAVGALPGATPIRADIVKHSLDYLDALSAEKIGDPSLQVELGEGYARLGTLIGHPTQDNLGELAKAGETYRKAIAILEPMGREPSNKRANLALAKARKDLGEILGFESESGEGVRLIEDSTRDFARLAERWPEDFDVRLQASITFEILALALSRPEGYIINRALDRSLPALREARDHAEAATRIRPGNAVAIDQLAITLKVSSDFTELSDHLAAAALCRETMAALDRLSAEDRRDPNARAKRSSGLLNCGNNLRYSGDFVGARRLLEEARDLRDDGWKEDPQNVLALRMRLDPYTYLLTVSSNSDRLRLHQILEGIFDAVEVHYPSSDAPEFDRAVLRAAAADLNFELGRRDEAIRLAGLAFPVLKRIALAPRALAVMQATAAKALLDSKVPGFADPKLALALAERANTRPDSTESVAMVTPADVLAYPAVLARAQWENGNPEGAIHAQERAVALLANAAPVLLAEARKTLERYRGQKS